MYCFFLTLFITFFFTPNPDGPFLSTEKEAAAEAR